jgi:hypothetical protein
MLASHAELAWVHVAAAVSAVAASAGGSHRMVLHALLAQCVALLTIALRPLSMHQGRLGCTPARMSPRHTWLQAAGKSHATVTD